MSLVAKAFFSLQLPSDFLLISAPEGMYKGFLLQKNGDLIISGEKFYRELLSRNRTLAGVRTTAYSRENSSDPVHGISKGAFEEFDAQQKKTAPH